MLAAEYLEEVSISQANDFFAVVIEFQHRPAVT